MARPLQLLACLLLTTALWAQTVPPQEQEPPEEDRPTESVPEYTLNPLQADKELGVGKFYLKRGSLKAAARRFEEATKWNPSLAEAWLRLGDVRLRLKDAKAARSAYEKYLEVDPDGKDAEEVRKRISRLKS